MRMERSKRQRAVALSGGVAAMSGSIPVLCRGHHVLLVFIMLMEVVLLGFALRLLYEAKHEC